MTKPKIKAPGKESKNQVLAAIEELCMIWEDSRKTVGNADEIIGKIYMTAHSFNSLNSCFRHHGDWREQIKKGE